MKSFLFPVGQDVVNYIPGKVCQPAKVAGYHPTTGDYLLVQRNQTLTAAPWAAAPENVYGADYSPKGCAVVWRKGGRENFSWHITEGYPSTAQGQEALEEIQRMGYHAFLTGNRERYLAIGFPETFAPGDPLPY